MINKYTVSFDGDSSFEVDLVPARNPGRYLVSVAATTHAGYEIGPVVPLASLVGAASLQDESSGGVSVSLGSNPPLTFVVVLGHLAALHLIFSGADIQSSLEITVERVSD